MSPSTAPSPQSICLVRLSALGDVCHTVPMVRALMAAWPHARWTWVIGQREYPLVKHLPHIRFVVFDKHANLSSARTLRKTLRKERFDLLILAQHSLRANLLSACIRARRRVGFGPTHAREGHRWFINETIELPQRLHEAEALFAFAPQLLQDSSVTLAQSDRALPVTREAEAFACQHQPKARHAVLISPCSSHPMRNWNAHGYAEVADRITADHGHPVILVGGPSDRERAMGQAIESAMKAPVINLIGQDTLDQAVGMLARAFCVITPDSGPAHMADGLGTPVIGLYAATASARSGPWASQRWCVDAFEQAARTFKHRSPDQLPWSTRIEQDGVMDLIQPDDVMAQFEALIAASAHTPAQ